MSTLRIKKAVEKEEIRNKKRNKSEWCKHDKNWFIIAEKNFKKVVDTSITV